MRSKPQIPLLLLYPIHLPMPDPSSATLVLETSSPAISWAYFEKQSLQCEARLDEPNAKTSQILSPSLKAANLPLKTIKTILVGVGPGSFSSIRAAISLAQGIARVSRASILPIRSSHALGVTHTHVSFLGVFADARRNSFFFTAYEKGKMTRPTATFPKDLLEEYLSKCSLALSTDEMNGVPESSYPDATNLFKAYQHQSTEDELALEPIYLHPPV
ncbi:MAG: tRNA (adenosine(37)-N6)-threonylcarbamoyltransferase complex dimerization subunit type 1 TsaB [Verrucomicrobiota bacterium]